MSKQQSSSLSIPSSSILNLIQHHLIESGLTQSSQSIQDETNIGSLGLLKHAHTQFIKDIKRGEWGNVLDILSSLTLQFGTSTTTAGSGDDDENGAITQRMNRQQEEAKKELLQGILAKVHEMAILELGDLGEMELAFATLKICREMLDQTNVTSEIQTTTEKEHGQQQESSGLVLNSSLGNSVERRLHALSALRTSATAATAITNDQLLPPDYYGDHGVTKEKRRNEIAKQLGDIIPILPQSRLVSLLQQSIKWQVHTGEMPMVKEQWMDGNEDEGAEDEDNDNDEEGGKKRKKKSKKDRQKKKKKRFDLVLGQVDIDEKKKHDSSSSKKKSSSSSKSSHEKIPLDPYSVIKFSKKTAVTSAAFYVDINAKKTSLVTGSSDGFIEVWDEDSKYTQLRMDLDYQKKDELMCHYADDDDDGNNGGKSSSTPSILALAVNSDGTMLASGDDKGSIQIWNLSKGSCLRSFDKVHNGAITCLDFSKDGEESSRILSASQDGKCREFGLRTRRMLKEFLGHTSFVNVCNYVLADKLLVCTASADSTVRLWDGRSAEILRVLNPISATGPSAVVSSSQQQAVTTDSNIHTVLNLHTPSNAMIVIPRGPKAYLLTHSGVILRTFTNDVSLTKQKSNEESSSGGGREDFVAGTVSPTNKWFYAITEGGLCICFDIATGRVEKLIRDFGVESTGGKSNIEITSVVHHPNKGILGAYSSSSSLKRGLLTVWK